MIFQTSNACHAMAKYVMWVLFKSNTLNSKFVHKL